MTPLLSLLLNGLPPGLWHLDRFDPVQRRLVEAFDRGIVVIDIDPHSGKLELLDRVADRLDFPHWFGRNWDALNDALFDLPHSIDTRPSTRSSPPGGPDLIVLRAVDRPDDDPAHDAEPGADAAVLLDIFSEVADETRRCVVVVGLAAGSAPTAG